MPILESWNLKSRSHNCHATGEPFTEGDTFHTALFEDPAGAGFERRDYSQAGWAARDAAEPAPFSHWLSIYTPPPKAPKKEEAVQKESAEELLRRLIEDDEAHTENARFILAVMLERQKILRQTDTNQIGETKLLIYEHRKSGEVLIVRDPDIPLAAIDSIQKEVADLLDQSPADSQDQRDQRDQPDQPDPSDPTDPPPTEPTEPTVAPEAPPQP